MSGILPYPREVMLGYLGGPRVITHILFCGRVGEAEVMVILCEKDLTTVAGFDDGERGHEPH